MTNEYNSLSRYVEPTEGAFAGNTHVARAASPYDLFMEEEGIPVHRTFGAHNVAELERSDWKRLGGRGAYLQPLGTEELWGMYVVEVPGAAALHAERHLYEVTCYVIAGRGTTEVWLDGQPESERTRFEWQQGALFSVPLNAWHRLVNAGKEPALLLVATTAPPMFNLQGDREFIFGTPHQFAERYRGQRDFFEFKPTLWQGPYDGRALMNTSLVPDIANAPLPLDNQRSTGYRRIEAYLANNSFFTFIGEHEVGRYAKAHYHPPSPVLVCLRGEGYTYAWPRELGTHPWSDGNADKVERQSYAPGGFVAAAPGGGDWFHQHFGVGREPLRFLIFGGLIRWGAFNAGTRPGEKTASMNLPLDQGGATIPYYAEDPHVRAEFEEHLARVGVRSAMDDALYRPPTET